MRVSRTLCAVVAAVPSVGVSVGVVVAQPAPLSSTGTVRISGADRYGTSAAVSSKSFTTPQGAVFVASGQNFPDALAGGAAAAKRVAPLLLTSSTRLPGGIATEIRRLHPAKIYILGGTGAVSASTASALAAIAPTQRIGGSDRYGTAANVSKATFATASTVYIASGLGFADALSGGPAAAKQGAPMLLTGTTSLPSATRTELARLRPTAVKILGGTGAVSSRVQDQIRAAVPGATITRYSGADRYATAANVARALWPTGSRAVFYASGTDFPDGLSATPAAAVNTAPLLLSTKSCMPGATSTATKTLNPALRAFIGGTGVIATSTTTCGNTAEAALNSLPVKGRAPKTGYSRDQFGAAWSDNVSVQGGHNGCDTRNDVLRRDLTNIVVKADSNGCTVLSGILHDPYSGKFINFVRGTATSSAVQIDHLVALSNAWQTGAQQLTFEKRRDFANDPLNLWAVDGTLNAQKGDGDAATWLPPNKAVRCLYVARQVAVKKTYHLWVTAPEKQAISNVLSGCPGQPLPTTAQWATPRP